MLCYVINEERNYELHVFFDFSKETVNNLVLSPIARKESYISYKLEANIPIKYWL